MSSGKIFVAIGLVAVCGVAVALLWPGSDSDRMVEVNTGRAAKLDATTGGDVVVDDRGDEIPDWLVKKAVAAALAATGGGVATEIERSDDPGEAFEVEVVRNGVEVDVALDDQLRRVPNERFEE